MNKYLFSNENRKRDMSMGMIHDVGFVMNNNFNCLFVNRSFGSTQKLNYHVRLLFKD